ALRRGDADFRAARERPALFDQGGRRVRRGDRAALRRPGMAGILSRAVARRLRGAPLLFRAHREGPALRARSGAARRGGARRVNRGKLLVLALLVAAAVAFFALGGSRLFSFDNVRALQGAVQAFEHEHPWQAAGGFFLAYVAITGLSLPGAAVMTLTAGAVFG